MSYIRYLSELNFKNWRKLVELYLENPLEHAYIFYDSIYDYNRSEIFLKIDKNIEGYLLIWKGFRSSVHIWGDSKELIRYIPVDKEMVIQIYNEDILNDIINYLKLSGEYEIKYYLDMVVKENDFNPYMIEEAVKLDPVRDLDNFLLIKDIQGRRIRREYAYYIIKKFRYYGVFRDRKLVSIACAYLRTPEVWIIGDVYTHPDYRNKGYAKSVTSAITRDAVQSGASAMLHVDKDNLFAIRLYKRLGYKVFSERPWIFYKASSNNT